MPWVLAKYATLPTKKKENSRKLHGPGSLVPQLVSSDSVARHLGKRVWPGGAIGITEPFD